MAGLRTSLALRLSLIGLLQVVMVVGAMIGYVRLSRPDHAEREQRERAFIEQAARLVDDPAALQAALEAAEEPLGVTITVRDPEGRELANTTPEDAPPCLGPMHRRGPHPPPGHGPHGEPPPPFDGEPPPPPPGMRRPRKPWMAMCYIAPMPFPDGRYGRIVFRPNKPPRPPSPFGTPVLIFGLLVIGATSLWLTRSIAKPLRRLSAAAGALGRGDLEARTGVERSDELGDVARAFDDMARRVGDLLRAEHELVANVSHELRTPLARIQVALDIAREGDGEAVRECLVDIEDDVAELDALVGDLLTAAKLDIAQPGGIPAVKREPVELGPLVEGAAERFGRSHPGRELHVTLPEEPPVVDADPALLRRVIDNLLDNAAKYSEDGIRLTVADGESDVELVVEDQGIGIAAEDLERVFEPFYRVDRSRTRQTGGHGLGLALVQRIVEAHGGTIALDSTPGEGTRATVRLPVPPPRAQRGDEVS